MRAELYMVLVVMILYTFQLSRQSANEATALASSQTWQEENQPQEYKEEEKTEEDTTRRPRGKRRRRLRKRQRTHTEDIVGTNYSEQTPDQLSEQGVTGEGMAVEYPRRKPGKRRRRPYRRNQDEEGGPPKPLRRRRKGGRKKIRPEIQEERNEAPEEFTRILDYEVDTTTVPMPIIYIHENSTNEKIEEVIIPTESYTKVYETVRPKRIKNIPKLKINEVNTEKEETSTDKPVPYGNKIFDRKKLFSSSRRLLPVTSAVIRKLSPNNKTNINDVASTEQPKIEKVEVDTENYPDKNKFMIKTNFLPEPYIVPTEFIKPDRLIEEIRKLAKTKEQQKEYKENDTVEKEEPNYPKIIPNLFQNKIKNKVQETTTFSPEVNIEIQEETTTNVLQTVQNKSMAEELEKMIDKLDLKSYNLTNFNDYILELLKTESGKDYLTRLLESRNMTLPQLLEHREKGASQFNFQFDIFQRKNNSEENTTSIATSITTTISTSTRSQVKKNKPKIPFPPDEVMHSFTKFLESDLKNFDHNIDDAVPNDISSMFTKENREPRVFESLQEFTTITEAPIKKEEKPSWRVIPNPKFRPVSVRGNYEEIPVSNILNKPIHNNINDVYTVDDNEDRIHNKYNQLTSEGAKRDGFGSFRKIPVSVKSAIIISGIILAITTFGFLSLLISCRVRQKKTIRRAKQDLMCEHLQSDDFMASQHSLSPVLTKHQQAYNNSNVTRSNPNNRHYYLWRTLRRTFRYD